MARRLLCCSADAHNHLARNLTRLCGATNSIEHSMYFHKQDLNGLSTGSVVAHNGEDSDTPSGVCPTSQGHDLGFDFALLGLPGRQTHAANIKRCFTLKYDGQ